MDKSIQNGDIVTLCWQGEDGLCLSVKVLNMPRGGGDLLQVEEIETGKVMAINTNCPDFSRLVKG